MSTPVENTSESIVRTCALLVLDSLHHSPAMQLLENETCRIIRTGLAGEASSDPKAQIMAALDIAKVMNPRKIAAKLRFEVSKNDTQIDLKRHGDDLKAENESSGDSLSIVAPPGISIEPLLAAIGFETYEALPAHIVTPRISPCESRGNNLNVIQGMLFLLAQASGMGFYLAHVASLGGLQEFLRSEHARTGNVEFGASSRDIIEFLKTIDISAVLESTTAEAHGGDMVLFSVPELPLAVLSHIGKEELNKVYGAEELVQALGLVGAGEVTGAELREREIPDPDEGSNGSSTGSEQND